MGSVFLRPHNPSFEISFPLHQKRPWSLTDLEIQLVKPGEGPSAMVTLILLRGLVAVREQQCHALAFGQQTAGPQGREKCCPAAGEKPAQLVFPLLRLRDATQMVGAGHQSAAHFHSLDLLT